MRFELRHGNFPIDDVVRQQVFQKMEAALDRFDRSIREVSVRLVDLNGPRGGEDKCCRVILRFQRGHALQVEGVAAELGVAIDFAAERATRVTAQRLERARPQRVSGLHSDRWPTLDSPVV